MTRLRSLAALACASALSACGGGGGGDAPGGPGGGGGGGGGSGPATFQPAAVAIGQTNLTSAVVGNPATASNLTGILGPSGNAAVNGTTLYVSDSYRNRILGFAALPTASGASADFVLGQASFTTGASGVSATALNQPTSLQVSGGKLFVADSGNSRVLVFGAAPSTSGAAADLAVGQADLTSKAQACTATGLRGAQGVAAGGTKLVVADTINNRILVWDGIPTASGAAASLVLGQPDFTHCTDRGAAGIYQPTGVWTDGTRLLVADEDGNRVLVWTTFPTANDEPPDLVLGQPDLTQKATVDPPTASSLALPTSIASDGTRLFVGSWNDARVLVWNTFPTTSNAPADVVLGQGDFTHGQENDDDQNGTIDAGPTARTLRGVRGLCLAAPNKLVVTDGFNYRYLIHSW